MLAPVLQLGIPQATIKGLGAAGVDGEAGQRHLGKNSVVDDNENETL